MDRDMLRRRTLIIFLAATFAVLGSLAVWATGGLPMLNRWYRSADALTRELPENDPAQMYARALEYQHDGDMTMAVAAARRATIAEPGYAPAHNFLAAEALRTKDYAEAARECRDVLKTNPKSGSATLGLANAYRGMGDDAKAEDIYRSTVESQAFNNIVRAQARQSLGEIKPHAAHSAPPTPPLPPTLPRTPSTTP